MGVIRHVSSKAVEDKKRFENPPLLVNDFSCCIIIRVPVKAVRAARVCISKDIESILSLAALIEGKGVKGQGC